MIFAVPIELKYRFYRVFKTVAAKQMSRTYRVASVVRLVSKRVGINVFEVVVGLFIFRPLLKLGDFFLEVAVFFLQKMDLILECKKIDLDRVKLIKDGVGFRNTNGSFHERKKPVER